MGDLLLININHLKDELQEQAAELVRTGQDQDSLWDEVTQSLQAVR